MMTVEHLKELGIASIGNRLSILKAVYQIKIAQNIAIEADHYIPPCTSNTTFQTSEAERCIQLNQWGRTVSLWMRYSIL